jgi:hypothetical protein
VAAGIDPLRPGLPNIGTMSGSGFLDELCKACPELQPLIEQHRRDFHGQVLLHLI